jgi:hypothetical protein
VEPTLEQEIRKG